MAILPDYRQIERNECDLQRIHALAREQNDPALMIGAHHALGVTLYLMGDFESARQHVKRGVQLWRSGVVQHLVEQVDSPAIVCLCYQALSEWHVGAIVSCQTTIAEAILLARELNDKHGLAVALFSAARFGCLERDLAGVERCASDLIQLSTPHNFAFWLAVGGILRGWARSASGDPVEGISWIEQGIRDYRATGSMLRVPYFLSLKAETLHLADRTSEALEAIREAEALAEWSGERWCSAELHRLRGVFLATLGADKTRIEASFNAAIPPRRSRSRFQWRSARRLATKNTAAKKRRVRMKPRRFIVKRSANFQASPCKMPVDRPHRRRPIRLDL